MWQKGDIYKSEYEGLYCTGCEEYKDKKELMETDVCPLHRTKCEQRKEENYFFALSKYQKQIESLIKDNPDFVRPETSRNEVSKSTRQPVTRERGAPPQGSSGPTHSAPFFSSPIACQHVPVSCDGVA